MPSSSIEILYFDGCPSWRMALHNLEAALRETGRDMSVERVSVHSHEDAEQKGFPGSPSIRVNGNDLFPTPGTSCLGCRIYRTPEGLKGYPTRTMIREALEAALSVKSNPSA